MDERDRALALEIVTGVQRWRALLDHCIAQVAARPLDRIDQQVLHILRSSTYQILHLQRVPVSAVVDDAVNLARRVGKASAGGFVNAILRNVSRRRGSLGLPVRPESLNREQVLDYLSVTLSHPRWLAARWLDRIGFDRTERWMQFDNRPSPMTLRVNRLRTSSTDLVARLGEEGVIAVPGLFAPDALTVMAGNPLDTSLASQGLFIVQDEASQLVALLAGEHPGPLVLDTCASPGGKATAVAAAALPHGWLVACDVRDRRVEVLKQTVHMTGTKNVRLVQTDARASLPFRTSFDCVIVDAPCSGLGTLRHNPDVRWRRRQEDLSDLAADQQRLLNSAAALVRPGGRLVYATCSSEPEENEMVVDVFLANSAAFVEVDAGQAHPALPATLVDHRGHLYTTPDRHDLEILFGAVLQRRA